MPSSAVAGWMAPARFSSALLLMPAGGYCQPAEAETDIIGKIIQPFIKLCPPQVNFAAIATLTSWPRRARTPARKRQTQLQMASGRTASLTPNAPCKSAGYICRSNGRHFARPLRQQVKPAPLCAGMAGYIRNSESPPRYSPAMDTGITVTTVSAITARAAKSNITTSHAAASSGYTSHLMIAFSINVIQTLRCFHISGCH